MPDAKVVLITGTSSGIGQAAARLLARRGHKVFGTSRNPSGAEKSPGVEMVLLDVRSDESAGACLDTVLQRAGRLDVLVNNAGYELAGALEEATVEEARAQFETNFFGVARMVQAALPAMRRQRSGHIINIGSMAGVTPMPFLGHYSATKSALEGYTEVLRHEVKPLGIRVSLVEATILKTQLDRNRLYGSQPVPDYEPWRSRALRAVEHYEATGPGPEGVARLILRIVESRNPRLRYRVGPHANLIFWSRRLLAESHFERATRAYFRLDRER